MPKIINKYYREFLKGGFIKTIEPEDIEQALTYITGNFTRECKTFLIASYYTGARPNEVLNLDSGLIKRVGSHIEIYMPGSKNGKARVLSIGLSKRWVKDFYNYVLSMPPNILLFPHLRNEYTRTRMTKKGLITYIETSDKLRYYFKKWFAFMDDPISPYYLRHNRFTKLSMKGASTGDIQQFKGSKTEASVMPYLHVSRKKSREISRMLD